MENFKHNRYEIDENDLFFEKYFPTSRVLQMEYRDDFNETKPYRMFEFWIRSYRKALRKLPKDLFSLEEARKVIWEKVKEIKEKYPEYFPERGWYDVQVWEEENFELISDLTPQELRKLDRLRKQQEREAYLKVLYEEKQEKARKRRYDILDAIAQVSMEEFSYLDVKPFLKDVKAREIRMLGRDIISVVQGSSGRRFRKIEHPCSGISIQPK